MAFYKIKNYMSLWNLKKSFPLFVLLCACVLSVSLRLHYSSNKIDPVLQDMYTQKAEYETLLSKQIEKNMEMDRVLGINILLEMQVKVNTGLIVDKWSEEEKIYNQILQLNDIIQSRLSIVDKEFLSWVNLEEEYRRKKDEVQNKINAYIHSNTDTEEVFQMNRNVQKLPSPTTIKKPNIKEQELRQELWLLKE